VLEIFPNREGVSRRIEDIRAGNQPSVLAHKLWRATLDEEKEKRKTSEHEESGPEHKHDALHPARPQ
jgi:hypothetical protein